MSERVQLPGPCGQIVVFGDTVFKVKYALSENSVVHHDSLNSDLLQADLKRVTEAALDQLLESSSHCTPSPLKTDYMVVYAGLRAWPLVAAKKLLFYESGRNLWAYPLTLYLLVHVFANPSHLDQASNQIIHRAKRPHPDAAMLPVNSAGCMPSEYLVRKKLRMEPPTDLPSCPGHTQTGFSSDHIPKVSASIEFEQAHRPEAMDRVNKEESFLSSIWRSIKTLFGWS